MQGTVAQMEEGIVETTDTEQDASPRFQAVSVYKIGQGPVSGFMTYHTDPKGITKGYGLWCATEEDAVALLVREAEKKGWKVCASQEAAAVDDGE